MSAEAPISPRHFLDFNPWWQSILVDGLRKRLKRPVDPQDPRDLALLAEAAHKLRCDMDWLQTPQESES